MEGATATEEQPCNPPGEPDICDSFESGHLRSAPRTGILTLLEGAPAMHNE